MHLQLIVIIQGICRTFKWQKNAGRSGSKVFTYNHVFFNKLIYCIINTYKKLPKEPSFSWSFFGINNFETPVRENMESRTSTKKIRDLLPGEEIVISGKF